MKRVREHWRGFMLATAGAVIAGRILLSWFFPAAGVDEREFLAVVFPETFAFSEKKGTPPHYEAYTLDAGGKPLALGAVFRSTEAAPVPRGYAGPVPVLVGLDREGVITGVRVLDHNETPSYAAGVEGPEFLQQFVGKSVGDPLRLDEDIDGVTRATVTASAVAEGVRLSARSIGAEVMGLPVPPGGAVPAPVPWLPLTAFVLLAGTALGSIHLKSAALRWTSLSLGIVLLGFWQGTYLSTATAVNILLGRLPAFREHLLWYALVIFGIGAALVWKNVYCARMCPFGALQEFLHLFSLRELKAGTGEERQARVLRHLFLWLVVLAVFGFERTEAANYEPFSTAFDFKGGALRWAFLGAVLLLANLRQRFWCRYFCPTGVWLGLVEGIKKR